MTDVYEAIKEYNDLRDTGKNVEYHFGKETTIGLEGGDQTRYDSVGDALVGIVTTAGSMLAGAGSATAGFIPDIGGLFVGIKDAVSAEDGQRIDAFVKGFNEFSKANLGSQYYKTIFDNFVDGLDINPTLKEDAKSGFTTGEFGGVGGTVTAGAKVGVKGVKRGLEKLGDQAQRELDLDTGGTALSSMGAGALDKTVKTAIAQFSAQRRQANALAEFIKKNPDGFTISMNNFESATKGIAVAPSKILEIKIDKKEFSPRMVRDLVRNVEELQKANPEMEALAGGWLNKDDGLYYLDAVNLFDKKDDALYTALAGKQEGIFDLEKFEYTDTLKGIDQLKQSGTYSADKANEYLGKREAIDRSVDPSGMETSTRQGIKDNLVNILKIRNEEMSKSPKDRTQPSGQPFFSRNYQTEFVPQSDVGVPVSTNTFPLNNRAIAVRDKGDAIADAIAEKLRNKVGSKEQFFYNTGPIIEKAKELGIDENTAKEKLSMFATNYAVTSPRTATAQNMLNASMVSAKQTANIPVQKIIGPGSGGANEKGYPMIINPGGLHRKLIDESAVGELNINTNPKPFSFAENVSGNLEPSTVDTHNIRAILLTMNDIEPGSVPIEWIKKPKQAQYKKDPSSLNALDLDDAFKTQMIDGKASKPEYGIFHEINKKVGQRLNVKPAEAQALMWFNFGDRTNLLSEPKTIIELLEDRIDVTSQLTKKSKDQVFKDFFTGASPLLSLGGMTLLDSGGAEYGESANES